MASTADFRNGLTLNHKDNLVSIVEFQHVKPGKGGAFVRTKLKNVKTGRVVEHTFRAGEKVEIVRLMNRKMQYLYRDSDGFCFMDMETYNQVTILTELVGDQARFMKESEMVDILYHGEDPLGVEIPFHVELKVVKTDPGVKGDTAQGGTKPAELESGGVVLVPLFINEGDVLRIDTRSGEYMERAKK
ncbi:MAG: elongation factor P [Candidatus Delongbacteria bacterium]|nr:elongation factor P [bacterium]MBL7032676.1 elongation factor P [Candidatus Delongbacteria bacterium]